MLRCRPPHAVPPPTPTPPPHPPFTSHNPPPPFPPTCIPTHLTRAQNRALIKTNRHCDAPHPGAPKSTQHAKNSTLSAGATVSDILAAKHRHNNKNEDTNWVVQRDKRPRSTVGRHSTEPHRTGRRRISSATTPHQQRNDAAPHRWKQSSSCAARARSTSSDYEPPSAGTWICSTTRASAPSSTRAMRRASDTTRERWNSSLFICTQGDHGSGSGSAPT